LRHLHIENILDTPIVAITYSNQDAQTAANVANAIADSYIHEFNARQKASLLNVDQSMLLDAKEARDASRRAIANVRLAIEPVGCIRYPSGENSFPQCPVDSHSNGYSPWDEPCTPAFLVWRETDVPTNDFQVLRNKAYEDEKWYEDVAALLKVDTETEMNSQFVRLVHRANAPAKPAFPNWPLIVAISLALSTLSWGVFLVLVDE
jgi:uncharacterized protein involved in exopolysaccharide biosynthesis